MISPATGLQSPCGEADTRGFHELTNGTDYGQQDPAVPVTRMDATARAGFPPSKAAAGIPREDMTDRWVRVMLRRGVSPTAPAAAAVPNREVIDDQTVLAKRGLCNSGGGGARRSRRRGEGMGSVSPLSRYPARFQGSPEKHHWLKLPRPGFLKPD